MSEIIRFNYLYRDSGNWKKFGSKKFSNPEQLSIKEIEHNIRQNLIDGEFFYPNQFGIKKFKFHRHLDDYSWYEFDSVDFIENLDLVKDKMESINNFFVLLENAKK